MAQIKTEPLTDYYEVKEELGRGRFAVVKRCVKLSTGEVYAAKCIRKARAGRRGREQLLLEIDILHNSDHPKMVKLYDVFETRTEMILILEYAAGGDLHKHCLEVESVRTEKEICSLIYQIVEAALYLHENHVVHLDLKPENILLKNDDKFPEIRLIDFGLSRRVDLPYSQYDIVGTPEYVAPEVLSYEPIKLSADMWSIGVVSYVLLSGISPFAGDDVMETYANIANVDFDFDAEEFDDISDEAKDFIESLLIKDPSERLTTKECLDHPWLKQMAGGVQRKDIEAALIAEEAFEKLIREEGISRLDSENSCFSSEADTQGDVEQVTSSDELSDMTTDDVENKENVVFLEEIQDTEEKPVAEIPSNSSIDVSTVVHEEEAIVESSHADTGSSSDCLSSKVDKKEHSKGLQLGEDRSDGCFPGNCQSSEVDERDHSKDSQLGHDRLIEDPMSRSIVTNKPSLPESNISFAGGFDIDSLISKDEDNAADNTSEIGDTPEKQNSPQGDINANVEVIEPLESVNGASRNSDSNLIKTESVHPKDSAVNKESLVKGDSSLQTNSIDLKKQINSDSVFTQRQASVPEHSCVTKEAGGKVFATRAKSVDDSLLSGKRRTSEMPKGGKLGAQLEKLTKAGLNIKEEPYRISHNSTHESPRTSYSGKSKGGVEKNESSKLMGSSNAASDRAKSDLGDSCFVDKSVEAKQKTITNSPKIPSKLNSESITKESPAKVENESSKLLSNGKVTPVTARKASSEKCSYPKKQSLGVPQGIAAQMASKFSSNADKASTPSPAKSNKMSSQSVISNRKYWEGGTPEAKRIEVVKSKQSSLKMDKTLFSNAVKVAKGEASQNQTIELEQKSKSPKSSPKISRSKNVSEVQVKDRAEQYMKVAADTDQKNTTQLSSPQTEKKIVKKSNRFENGGLLETNLKKTSSKEDIVQKFEKQRKQDSLGSTNQVNVQPKGLQFSFSLQAGNKFRIKDVNTEKDSPDTGSSKLALNAIQEGKKTVTFDTKKEKPSRRKIEPVTIPKSFGGVPEEDEVHGNEHIEHTAIGALATMPRTPLRDLRSKSRTSRDGGSPSSPRKAYRRLYVTHVKGSKSEQENEVSEDIADIKTKMEKDELKVELLVKFGTL